MRREETLDRGLENREMQNCVTLDRETGDREIPNRGTRDRERKNKLGCPLSRSKVYAKRSFLILRRITTGRRRTT